MRVGGVPEHFNLPWHRARSSAALDEAGIRFDWTDYTTGTGAMLADLAARRLDLAILLTEGAALGIARGEPLVPVSLYTTSPLIWGVHVAADSRHRSIADLRGARFGISRRGSGSHLMSLALAMEQGWPADAQSFVIVDDLPGAIAAFAAGDIDVFLWEHFTTQPAVDAGAMRRVDDFSGPWPAWVVCVHADVWRSRQADIERLVQIVADQARDLVASPDAASIIAERYGLEPAAVSDWLARTEWVGGMSRPDDALETARRMLERAGAIS